MPGDTSPGMPRHTPGFPAGLYAPAEDKNDLRFLPTVEMTGKLSIDLALRLPHNMKVSLA
ncbi:MAG: hypothetical protein STSR0002_25330 [Smithella sp.]